MRDISKYTILIFMLFFSFVENVVAVNCLELVNQKDISACIKMNSESLAREKGHIIGVVTEEKTGKPLEHVSVSAGHMGDQTNEKGEFNVPYQEPGVVELTASRRDLETFKSEVKIKAGKVTRFDFSMKSQKIPCCKLEGMWKIKLIYNVNGKRQEVEGTILFDSKYHALERTHRKKVMDSVVADEYGRFNIDIERLLGVGFINTGATKISPKNNDTLLTEVKGYVYNNNLVNIDLIPRLPHGGLTLNGIMTKDSIKGKWYKREYAITQLGEFYMEKSVAIK